MQIVVHGMNHRTAPLEVRERAAFLPDEMAEAIAELKHGGAVAEVCLLSTCNRTEFYATAADPEAALVSQRDLLRKRKGVDLDGASLTYVHREAESVRHLFRVASGLDSMVLGETAILGQVKEAYQAALREESAGPILARMFSQALHVGKRCRSETQIGKGAVSLEKSAVQVAGKVFGNLSRRSALVVGGGDSAERLAMLLREAGLSRIAFANRTRAKAEELAALHDGSVTDMDSLPAALAETDIVLTAVAARDKVVGPAEMKPALATRRRGPILLLDLGVPRNVDPECGRHESVFLYAVDDLRDLCERNLGLRAREVPAVEAIVAEETERFLRWMVSLRTTPVVVALREEADRVRRETVDRFGRGLDPESRELLERFSTGLVNKLLHAPTVAVRDCDPETGEGLTGLAWARRLFGLDGGEK